MSEHIDDQTYNNIVQSFNDVSQWKKRFLYKYGIFIDGFGMLLTLVLLSAQMFQYAFASFILLYPDWQDIANYFKTQ